MANHNTEAEPFRSILEGVPTDRASLESVLAERMAEIRRLRTALEAIANDPHCAYDHPANQEGQYAIGVADGHRCAATKARAALQQKGASDTEGESHAE